MLWVVIFVGLVKSTGSSPFGGCANGIGCTNIAARWRDCHVISFSLCPTEYEYFSNFLLSSLISANPLSWQRTNQNQNQNHQCTFYVVAVSRFGKPYWAITKQRPAQCNVSMASASRLLVSPIQTRRCRSQPHSPRSPRSPRSPQYVL